MVQSLNCTQKIDEDGDELYYSIYSCEISNGQRYQNTFNQSQNELLVKGSKMKIHYNPKKPSDSEVKITFPHDIFPYLILLPILIIIHIVIKKMNLTMI